MRILSSQRSHLLRLPFRARLAVNGGPVRVVVCEGELADAALPLFGRSVVAARALVEITHVVRRSLQ